ncbi:MAG TPA: DNA starvation/stationary phase protection protein [Bacteroidia bacterium]
MITKQKPSKNTDTKFIKPNIGISEKNLNSVCTILEVVLSDDMTLYVKTRKYHWNVSGESFMELHKLFQDQYTKLEEVIDLTAERINQLGRPTIGTMREFIQLSFLKESPKSYPGKVEMLNDLLKDHEYMATQLRKDIKECSEKFDDSGTADFLTKVMEIHEKEAWVLRRYKN